MTRLQDSGSQEFLADRSTSAVAKYQALVVGERGLWKLFKYELITCLFGPLPGAIGFFLRQLFYPCVFRQCGRGVLFGRNLTVRNPGRIRLGSHVVLSDDVLLDAKGTEGEGILIRDGVFIGRGTAITMIDGTLEIDEGANIGTYCRIGTYGHTRIGKKALIAAFVYVVGADHKSDRTDIPVLDQPNFTHGGVIVGDGTWLGTKVSVKDGVTIGRDCIVGAHALVTENLPDFAIAVGIPAKVVKMRK